MNDQLRHYRAHRETLSLNDLYAIGMRRTLATQPLTMPGQSREGLVSSLCHHLGILLDEIEQAGERVPD